MKWAPLLALLAGIAGAAEPGAAPRLSILTSFYPVYLATLNVAGNAPGVEVSNLTRPTTGCLHDYQMSPDDMVALSKADVFVINGAGMEAFLDRALKRAPRLRVVDASEGIELLRGAGGEANPHVWVSVRLAIRQVRNIARGLETLDPARAPAYAVGASNYVARLEALDVRMREGLSGVAGRDIVTFHEAFPYFARDFGLRVAGVVEREPGSEPGARELAATIETVRRLKVRALFAEPQYPGKCAETIARETGCRVRTLDPVVSGPPDKDAYVAAMERNLTVLQEALR